MNGETNDKALAGDIVGDVHPGRGKRGIGDFWASRSEHAGGGRYAVELQASWSGLPVRGGDQDPSILGTISRAGIRFTTSLRQKRHMIATYIIRILGTIGFALAMLISRKAHALDALLFVNF